MEQQEQLELRTQRIIGYLEDAWKRPYQPSPETLKRITAFVLSLPEQYQMSGLQTIAQGCMKKL
jgi:hypothetical protein